MKTKAHNPLYALLPSALAKGEAVRRPLALFSLCFALGAFLSVQLLGLACGFAFVPTLLLRRKCRHKHLRLALLGMLAAFFWCALFCFTQMVLTVSFIEDDVPFTATVVDYSEQSDYGISVAARVDTPIGLSVPACLYLNDGETELEPGDTLSATGTFLTPFSEKRALFLSYASQGQFLRGTRLKDVTIISGQGGLRYFPQRTRHILQVKIDTLFEGETAAVLQALLTGNRSLLSGKYTSALRRTGTTHMFAVSGLHVSFFVTLVLLFTGGSRLASLLCLPLLGWFCLMTGGSPSVVRATLMMVLVLLAPFLGQEADGLTSLGAALTVLLLHNPYAIKDVGLQLSFASMLGLLTFTPWLNQALTPHKDLPKGSVAAKLLGFARGTLSMCTGATVFTLPLSAYYFGMFSLLVFIADLIVVPFLSLLFSLGALTLLVSLVCPPLAVLPAFLTRIAALPVIQLPLLLSQLPFAVLNTSSGFTIVFLVSLYLILLLAVLMPGLRERLALPFGTAAVLLAVTLACQQCYLNSSTLMTKVLDVGQGQCILFYSGSSSVAVDCGGSRDAGALLAQTLSELNLNHLDALVLTHYDSDHTNGLETLLEQCTVETLYLPDVVDDSGRRSAVLQAAMDTSTPIQWVSENRTQTFGSAELTIYAPVSAETDNDACIAARCSCGTFDVLVPGDLSAEAELLLARREQLHDIEALVVSHHGSRYSSSPEFLAAIEPEYALISVGTNTYGHPTGEVLQRLCDAGCTICRTDLNGTITLRCS